MTLSAAKQGFWKITFDNITGSNIANIYLILGFSGLIYPVAVEQISIFFTTPAMILISVILLVFISTGWEIKKWELTALVAFYAAFLIVLLRMG